MATRKRSSRRSGLVDRAVSAGRRALKEAESRIPPDLRRQVDRRLKDADKTARAAIKQLQIQVKRASTRADVNSVLKRIDGLTRQARQIAAATGPSKATPRRRPASTARKPATRKPATTKAATRKAATRKAATRKTAATTKRPAATTRRAAPRRRTSVVVPEVMPIAEVEEIDIIEVEP